MLVDRSNMTDPGRSRRRFARTARRMLGLTSASIRAMVAVTTAGELATPLKS
jgi:hypothetical protein